MNRLTPAPPVGAPPRFPSGWRARLGRDPVPILLREGGPALVARVRRDLIDDDEAPGPAEVVTYPEVKSFLKKQEKNGAFPAKPPEKTLGLPKFRARVATLRALEKMAEFGLGKAHPAGRTRGRVAVLVAGRPTAASPISRWARRPRRGRARSRSISRAGRCRRCAGPATTPTRASRRGFTSCCEPAGRRRLGLARGAHRLGRAAVQPPGDRAWCCARSPRRRRGGPRARRAAPPSCWRRASCSPIAIPTARRPASGSS